MTVRGLIIFDLTRPKHIAYFCSYLFLLVASVATLIVMRACRKEERHIGILIAQIYTYSFCLMCWATFVSCVDCIANGDSSAMVYVMVSISIGALTLIKPRYYASMLAISGTAFLVVTYFLREHPYSSGFYINFVIFVMLAVFINWHTYTLSIREFEAGNRLKRLSYTDQLTGVYNRRHLDRQISLRAGQQEEYLFTLIDVDDFKIINDTYGHAVGDTCLVLIAETLREHFGDGVYRFGGDEFAIISSLDENSASEQIDAVNRKLVGACEGIKLHISAGIYRTKVGDETGAVFIRADRALYRAKGNGKGKSVIFDKDDE